MIVHQRFFFVYPGSYVIYVDSLHLGWSFCYKKKNYVKNYEF